MADEDGTTSTTATQSGTQQAQAEASFPANTPLEQMSVEQREAYWKHQARKHEDRSKAFGNLTADELKQLRDDASRARALDQELSSEADKRATQARQDAEQAADAKYKPMLAETAFRIAIGDRKTEDEVNEFIADLNLPRFLTDDGRVDTARVLARVAEFAPATGAAAPPVTRTGPTTAGQGNRSGNTRSAPGMGNVSAGRDLYAELHAKK